MTICKSTIYASLSAAAFAALVSASPVPAQHAGQHAGSGSQAWGPGMLSDPGWSPEMLMGPGSMEWHIMGPDMCDPRAAGLAEWRAASIEQAIRPDDAQRSALDQLKAVATKAAETIVASCPRALPRSPVERLEAIERRHEVMLQAVRTVRPAFEAFYASLTDEQKARLNPVASQRPGWREWLWPWGQRGGS